MTDYKALREAFVSGALAYAGDEWDSRVLIAQARDEADLRYPAPRQPEAGVPGGTDPGEIDVPDAEPANPPKEPRFVCRECHAINPGETFHWIDGKVYHPSRYDVRHGCGPVEPESREGGER